LSQNKLVILDLFIFDDTFIDNFYTSDRDICT